MSDVTICDNCGAIYDRMGDDAHRWTAVGWKEGEKHDACTIGCARALLDVMQQLEWDIEAENEREAATA